MWKYRTDPAARRRMHRHLELEINLVLSGSATYLIDDFRYSLTQGTQIWLFPAQEHLLIEESPDYVTWVLVFKPAMLQRVCTDAATSPLLLSRPTGLFCKQMPAASTARLDTMFAQVHELSDQTARFNAALAHAMLTAWSLHSQAEDDTMRGDDVHPAVERALHLLGREYPPSTLDELALASGLSASRLGRVFKRDTGISLSRYRQRRRIERFLDLYGRGRYHNVMEAALKAGFGSYPQFHRVFKQFFGFGPAEYRRRLEAKPRSTEPVGRLK